MPAELIVGVDVPAAMLWDFDGALVETEDHWHSAEARLLAEWGLVLTPEQKLRLTGLNLTTAIATMMEWALEDSRPGLESSSGAGVPTIGIPFTQQLDGGPMRQLIPTLDGVGLVELGGLWRVMRDA